MAIFEEDGEWSHDKSERAMIRMQEHSLIRFSRQSDGQILVSLYSMVSEWLRLRLEKGVLLTTKWRLRIWRFTLNQQNSTTFSSRGALLHMDNICRIATDDIAKFCFMFGQIYPKHDRLETSALWLELSRLGPEHRSTLNMVENLGRFYADQGLLTNAEIMFQRALDEKEKVLGPEHIATLSTVDNVGLMPRKCTNVLWLDLRRYWGQSTLPPLTWLPPSRISMLIKGVQ